MKTFKKSRSKKISPEELHFKMNTKDTGPELTLFYNIALDRINDLVSFYEKKPVYIESLELNTDELLFQETTYLHLKIFLWKEEISKRYTQINRDDRALVNTTLKKLVDLRNFHSHFYHDAEALKFPKVLINHITLQLDVRK